MVPQIATYRDCRRLLMARAEEKRRHERQPFTSAVRYAVITGESTGAAAAYFAVTVDISMQGLGVRTNAQLDPGSVIWLQSDREDLRGLVRWIDREAKNGCYRAGLQLLQREV